MPRETAILQPFLKKSLNLSQEIVVMGVDLHIPGSALHVHQDYRRLMGRGQGGPWPGRRRRALIIVDQEGSGFQGRPGHGAL